MKIEIPVPAEQLVRDPFEGTDSAARVAMSLPPDERVELLEAVLLRCAQADLPVEHIFAPGVYMRQGKIPKGMFLIGHRHKTEHLNIVFCGRVTVLLENETFDVTGPATFTSAAGTRKIIYAHEDSIMANVHPTTETDLDKIEELMVEKSETFNLHQSGLKSQMMRLAESLALEPAQLGNEEN